MELFRFWNDLTIRPFVDLMGPNMYESIEAKQIEFLGTWIIEWISKRHMTNILGKFYFCHTIISYYFYFLLS